MDAEKRKWFAQEAKRIQDETVAADTPENEERLRKLLGEKGVTLSEAKGKQPRQYQFTTFDGHQLGPITLRDAEQLLEKLSAPKK